MPRNPAKNKTIGPSGSTQEKKKPQPPKPERPEMELVRNDQVKVPKPKPTADEADHKAKGSWTGHEQPALEPEPEYKFERGDGCQDAPSLPEEPPAPPVQVIERRIETVTVEIPLGEPPTIPSRVSFEVVLIRKHAATFARLRQGLRDKGAKTVNGRLVDTKPDVMRWLLEQFDSC